jgi:hypothetical protein
MMTFDSFTYFIFCEICSNFSLEKLLRKFRLGHQTWKYLENGLSFAILT